jgi:1,2-diacylglycerol 3-beta-glucosyltransferase
MPENSWPEKDFCSLPKSLGAALIETAERAEMEESPDYPGGEGRRRKAALILALVWSSTIALHLMSGGVWLVYGMTTLMGVHALRLLCAQAMPLPEPLSSDLTETDYPYVSLLVAAKNEVSVIGELVETLCAVDYPSSRYELWVVDDNSTDHTFQVLQTLTQKYPQLQLKRRGADAGGGKSGALNQILPLTKGDIIGVFDADARVTPDLLRQVVPFFERQRVGAVQVRKAIANTSTNFWTRGQSSEMILDAFWQQRRIALGGIGELRGNGQFVRRAALKKCGGWNEETITDDLDLTLRLHLSNWDVDFLLQPAVQEEGVTQAVALWHQRNRWAEGGYQRYLDYWPLLIRNRLGFRKSVDLLMFWITQYFLPSAAVPDLLMATTRNQLPLLTPITGLTLGLSVVGMWVGLDRVRRQQEQPFQPWTLLMQTLRGTLYMCHWFLVVASMMARMSVRPKRLKWVKTTHQGTSEVCIQE